VTVGAAVNEGGAAEIRAMGTAAAAATGAPLADFFHLPLALVSANTATVASSVSDDDAGKSASDETPMASSAAAATAARGSTVRAADLLAERLRMGLADSEGGVFLARMDV
jgi:hypothetical protein